MSKVVTESSETSESETSESETSLSPERDAPPKKRARKESKKASRSTTTKNSSLPKRLTRDESFWYDDGNVVLATGGVAFRVHNSVVASQSAVLSDLLKSASHLDQLEGCPVVELADSAEDVRNLLAALYDSKRFLAFAEVPPHLIMSLIRLGHNYEIDEIRDFALLELQKLYPAAFNAWTRKITCAPAYAIPAVNLARLTEEHSILPLALYDCSARLDVYALLAGTSRADGTIDKLSDEDIIRCLQGKELLRKHLIDATTRFFGMSPLC